ncbi:hypothetical protein B0H67DRAFT_119246 [Lasiosphaeris hirsuta]|uniref:Uncharacterized protein n=1 Tax=Lasiosphaeris hirsuta TaxID=260670 RepID=A0AA40AZP9_9PEZI|nr:hypothetical protein B0H67DRAFT_119246 [Lasiosphaeris hirsuta]
MAQKGKGPPCADPRANASVSHARRVSACEPRLNGQCRWHRFNRNIDLINRITKNNGRRLALAIPKEQGRIPDHTAELSSGPSFHAEQAESGSEHHAVPRSPHSPRCERPPTVPSGGGRRDQQPRHRPVSHASARGRGGWG